MEMLMARSSYSEEKLLGLIRKQKPAGLAVSVNAPASEPLSFWITASRFLAVTSIILLVVLALRYRIVSQDEALRPEMAIVEPVVSEKANLSAAVLMDRADSGDYREAMARRNIFLMPYEKKETAPIAASVTSITDRYKLRGIILDTNPTAIIEDTQIQRSIFVTRGQMVGEARLEDIKEDHVTLSYQGEQVQLVR